jgi:hypothetical protein
MGQTLAQQIVFEDIATAKGRVFESLATLRGPTSYLCALPVVYITVICGY